MLTTRSIQFSKFARYLTAIVIFGFATECAFAADHWAAIAFSFKTRQRGYAYGKTSRAAAERLAIANTKAADAKVVAVSRNAWAALVQSNHGNGAGTGVSLSKQAAIDQAFKNCPDSGGKKLTIIIHSGN